MTAKEAIEAIKILKTDIMGICKPTQELYDKCIEALEQQIPKIAETNFERIKSMSVDELAAFLIKVNLAYSEDCMIGISECKHLQVDGGCCLCFKEWLESEVVQNGENA